MSNILRKKKFVIGKPRVDNSINNQKIEVVETLTNMEN